MGDFFFSASRAPLRGVLGVDGARAMPPIAMALGWVFAAVHRAL